jgi:hypothetical protein
VLTAVLVVVGDSGKDLELESSDVSHTWALVQPVGSSADIVKSVDARSETSSIKLKCFRQVRFASDLYEAA